MKFSETEEGKMILIEFYNAWDRTNIQFNKLKFDKAINDAFKAGQESWKDKGIMEDVIEVAKKQARQDFAEEVIKDLKLCNGFEPWIEEEIREFAKKVKT